MKAEAQLTSHGKSPESPFGLQLLCISDRRLRRQNNGVQDEAVLVPFHLLHHLRLLFWRAVVVDNAQPAQKSHMDGHVVFSHRVHGRRQERGLQGEPPGYLGIQGNVRCWESCLRD